MDYARGQGSTGGGRPLDCLKCVHFKVTWDVAHPRSCSVFGIKCATLPSMEVLRATGRQCPSFQLKAGNGR